MAVRPIPRRAVKIVGRASRRIACPMADDKKRAAGGTSPRHHIDDPWKRRGVVHAGAINAALQPGPLVLPSDAPEIVSNSQFIDGNVIRDLAILKGGVMEEAVIANDRIVEVKSDAHPLHPHPVRKRGRDAGDDIVDSEARLATGICL